MSSKRGNEGLDGTLVKRQRTDENNTVAVSAGSAGKPVRYGPLRSVSCAPGCCDPQERSYSWLQYQNVPQGRCLSSSIAQVPSAVAQGSWGRTGRGQLLQAIRRTSDLFAPTMMLEGHGSEVYSCKFSPGEGDLFASAGHDRSIFLWRTWGECENFATLTGHKNAILELHWSNDGERIISASPDKTVRAWDLAKGVQVKKMNEHSDAVNSCAYMRRGSNPLVVSGGDDRQIKVWDMRSRRSVQTMTDNFQVLSVCFGDGGDSIYSGGIDNTVKVWDLRKEQVSLTLTGHGDSVTGMSLSPDGNHLLTNAMDNTLRIWDVRPYAPANRCFKVFTGHQHNFEKNLLKCCWSPDGERITAGSSDRLVNVWEVQTQRLLYKLPGHKGSVNEATFHPSQPIIASCSSDKTIFLGEIAAA